jgi:hypothetical protein
MEKSQRRADLLLRSLQEKRLREGMLSGQQAERQRLGLEERRVGVLETGTAQQATLAQQREQREQERHSEMMQELRDLRTVREGTLPQLIDARLAELGITIQKGKEFKETGPTREAVTTKEREEAITATERSIAERPTIPLEAQARKAQLQREIAQADLDVADIAQQGNILAKKYELLGMQMQRLIDLAGKGVYPEIEVQLAEAERARAQAAAIPDEQALRRNQLVLSNMQIQLEKARLRELQKRRASEDEMNRRNRIIDLLQIKQKMSTTGQIPTGAVNAMMRADSNLQDAINNILKSESDIDRATTRINQAIDYYKRITTELGATGFTDSDITISIPKTLRRDPKRDIKIPVPNFPDRTMEGQPATQSLINQIDAFYNSISDIPEVTETEQQRLQREKESGRESVVIPPEETGVTETAREEVIQKIRAGDSAWLRALPIKPTQAEFDAAALLVQEQPAPQPTTTTPKPPKRTTPKPVPAEFQVKFTKLVKQRLAETLDARAFARQIYALMKEYDIDIKEYPRLRAEAEVSK